MQKSTDDVAWKVDHTFLSYFGQDAYEAFRKDEAVFAKHGTTLREVNHWSGDLLDSLDRIEFFMAIEDTFKLDIPEHKAEEIEKRSDVIELVKAEISAAS